MILSDNQGLSVSLDEIKNKKLPWPEASVEFANLYDLPCRLESTTLKVFLQQLWLVCSDLADVQFQIPHPRHDIFLTDLGYVRPVLPETLMQLDPKESTTGLSTQLGVRYDLVQVVFKLDPHWQKGIDEKQITFDDIHLIAKQASNVIEWFDIKMKIKKTLWIENEQTKLTAEMKDQLMTQIKNHEERGDHQAAEVIRQFIESQKS